jgi:hypothetical protein
MVSAQIFTEYPGFHREILDNSHNKFILYFTNSEKQHPNHMEQQKLCTMQA